MGMPPCEGLPLHVCGSDSALRQKVERILATGPCGLILSDAIEADCPIIYVNRIFEYMTGYRASELLGRNCRFLQYRGAYATERHALVDQRQVLAIRNAIEQFKEFEGEVVNFHRDGTPLINSLHLQPIFGDPRNPHVVTLYLGLQRFRPANVRLGPLPPRPSPERALLAPPPPEKAVLALAPPALEAVERDRKSTSTPVGDIRQLNPEVLSYCLSLLDPRSLAAASMSCRTIRDIARNDSLWYTVAANTWGEQQVAFLIPPALKVGWKNVAQRLVTLKSMNWRKFKVGGLVDPPRSNFSACAVGDHRMLLFGGGGAHSAALSDTYLLDLSEERPQWRPVRAKQEPKGRWGHTLRWLRDSWVVLFGGCSAHGSLNDLHLLDLAAPEPCWIEVAVPSPPSPRSWHSSCTVRGTQLVIFGGCSESGHLLSDTHICDLGEDAPRWREVPVVGWRPPARLGNSLCVTGGSKLLMYGGLASAGPVRLRSSDACILDLDSRAPSWEYVTGSTLPSGASTEGAPPPPRLEHVSSAIIGGRVIVFGGSISGNCPASELFVVNPNEEFPAWRRVQVTGPAPREAWGYSACTLGSARIVVPCGNVGGEVELNELHELSVVGDVDALAEELMRGGGGGGGGFTAEAARVGRAGRAGSPWDPSDGQHMAGPSDGQRAEGERRGSATSDDHQGEMSDITSPDSYRMPPHFMATARVRGRGGGAGGGARGQGQDEEAEAGRKDSTDALHDTGLSPVPRPPLAPPPRCGSA